MYNSNLYGLSVEVLCNRTANLLINLVFDFLYFANLNGRFYKSKLMM